MNRRGFMGAILATFTAPAIVRADSLMRIVAPRPLITHMQTFFLPPGIKDNSDPFGLRGFAGARCLRDGVCYGVVLDVLEDPFMPNARLMRDYAELELRRCLLTDEGRRGAVYGQRQLGLQLGLLLQCG